MTGAFAAALPFPAAILPAAATPEFFVQIALLLIAAAVIVYASARFGLMPIVGFLLAGVLIGPFGLGLIRDPEMVDALAEVGVILLLFTIGIEFSLDRLARIRRLVFGAGALQLALATLATLGVLALCGVDWRAGLFTGFLVALSSTAIVVKLLADRGESGSRHGQVGVGILVFQDLAIIAMALVVPILAGSGGSASGVAVALAKAAAILAGVLLVARRLMPRLLEMVARTCSPEIFLLAVIAFCFGTAWLTSLAGLSLSLGAFLAGLLVSESRFSEYALGEILPLQVLFSATFFVSVGMLLDLGFLARHLPLVLGVVAAVLALKVVTTSASVLAFGERLPVAAAVGLGLAQVGEFSFVLERQGRAVGLYPGGSAEAGSQAFIAATVLLMAATPFLTGAGAAWAATIERGMPAANRAPAPDDPPAPTHHVPAFENHVIVSGYGDAARQLVHVLRGSNVPFLITTLSPGGANEAEAEGLPVLRGDSTRPRTFQVAGIERARMLVVPDDDPGMAHRIIAVARAMNPSLRIVVRTRHVHEAEHLERGGADRVIAEEREGVVALFGEVLRDFDVPPAEIAAHEEAVRRGGYAALGNGSAPVAQAFSTPASRAIDTETSIALAAAGAGCPHAAALPQVRPRTRGCEECLQSGSRWIHLRLCMTCGHVGCCDSSPNRHATKHHHATGHPIMRSLEPGESWGWCYVDQVEL